MAKVDRLGWAAGLSFVSYGRRIGVRVSSPALLSRVERLLPPGWTRSPSPIVKRLYSVFVGGDGPRPGVRRLHLAYANTLRIARTANLDLALEALESDLRLYVAERARRRVFVHAGVVGWRGRAIVIPGRSFSGKSSLVAALVRAGATYYSDEYAVFDERGRVHPFRAPLSMRGKDGEGSTRHAPETLGGPLGGGPLPVGLVAVSQYRPGARWRPRRLTPGQGVLALLANTVPARQRPAAALAALRQAVAEASILKGMRGEAEEVAGVLLENVG
jgi:hypothetical protein